MTSTWNPHLPPTHRLTRITLDLDLSPGLEPRITITGHSDTHKGRLWQVETHAALEPSDPHDWLILAQMVQVLVEDFLRDRPGTEERALFVLSGGLYEQLGLYDADR